MYGENTNTIAIPIHCIHSTTILCDSSYCRVISVCTQLPWFLRVCVLTPSLLVLAPSLLVLGPVVYGKWSRASKEAVFKEKFVQHMKEKVQLQVKATNNSHIAQLQGE